MKHLLHRTPLVCSVCAGMFLVSGCALKAPTQAVSLYFYSLEDIRNAEFTHPFIVHRAVNVDAVQAMDTALRQLFAGPTPQEQAAGALTSADLTALGPLYLGVRMDGTTAVVNFKSQALQILNSAAARQFMAKSPIHAVLMQFPGVQDVGYAIDGKLFNEWDA